MPLTPEDAQRMTREMVSAVVGGCGTGALLTGAAMGGWLPGAAAGCAYGAITGAITQAASHAAAAPSSK